MNTSTAVVQKKNETPIDKLPAKQNSLINIMAEKYNLEPLAFSNAIKKTAMPANATNEEFAAFMMVAHEYKLNPILREIYAFPRKGGGIVPIVSIDGWVNLVHQNKNFDGINFEMHYGEKKELVACTCTIFRKDKSHPTIVTEYLAECFRNTDPWKMKHRMLRHKALIQCARYAFGLAGVYDEDEGADQAMKDVTPKRPQITDFVNPAQQEQAEVEQTKPTETVNTETGEITQDEPAEFGAFEAMEMGRQARRDNRPYKPTEWLGGANESYDDAFKVGWNEVDAELRRK